MGQSGISSEFQFVSYKIDEFNCEMTKQLQLLFFTGTFQSEDWNVSIALGVPSYIINKKSYLVSFKINCKLMPSNDDVLCNLTTGITGVFKVNEKLANEDIVKVHFPTLLLPYLRGTISSFLANAGFGNFILPLFNMHELAREQLNDVPINEID